MSKASTSTPRAKGVPSCCHPRHCMLRYVARGVITDELYLPQQWLMYPDWEDVQFGLTLYTWELTITVSFVSSYILTINCKRASVLDCSFKFYLILCQVRTKVNLKRAFYGVTYATLACILMLPPFVLESWRFTKICSQPAYPKHSDRTLEPSTKALYHRYFA